MEELNSWWARGGGGFAWIRLVKCRKVHKETLVLFPSVSQRLNKVQFCQINQKTLTERYSSFLWSCRCVAAMPAEHDRSAHVYNLSHASLWELDSELWASSLCAFHVFVTWMKTCWSRWQFGRLTEVEKAAGEGGEGRDISAESETDVRRETTALLQMRKIR